MQSGPTSRFEWLTARLDISAAVVGLVLAVLLVPLRFVTSQIHIRTIPLVLGAACGVYLVSRWRTASGGPPTLSRGIASFLPGVVLLALGGLTLLATIDGERSPLFYYLAIGIAAAILIQIVYLHDRDFAVPVILGQVVAFAFVVRFAALLTTPGYVGIDVWTHVGMAGEILDAGSLAPIADNKYYASPLYHLLLATAASLLGLTLRAALFVTIGVAMPLATLFVYGAASYLVPRRWATFAAATFGIAGSVTEWGIHLIPTSLGLVFFGGLVYGVVRILHVEYTARDFVLVVFFSVAIILTHQVSAFIMLVFVSGGLIAQFLSRVVDLTVGDLADLELRTVRRRETVNMVGLFVFDLGLITFMWSTTPYQGSTFLETLASYFQTALQTAGFLAGVTGGEAAAAAGGGGSVLLGTVVTYVDVAELLVLLFATVVGSLYVLRRENVSHATLTLVVATVAMFVFTFIPSLFGIDTFLPGRWWAFIAVPMALVGAVGIGYLSEQLDPSVAVLVLFLFAVAFPAVAVASSPATIDNPPFEPVQTRYSYTGPELRAVEAIGAGGSPDRTVYTDHPYQTVIERTGSASAEPAIVDNGTSTHTWLIHRRYQTTGATFFRYGESGAYKPAVTLEELCGDRDYLYDNGDVTICYDPATAGAG